MAFRVDEKHYQVDCKPKCDLDQENWITYLLYCLNLMNTKVSYFKI